VAWSGSHTAAIPNGRRAAYYVKEQLKVQGWTVRASGDGSAAYSSSSDVITSAGNGAGGMDHTNSWFVMYKTCPLTLQKREFCWQNGSTLGQIALFDSHTNNFTGGSPSATRRPSATGEKAVKGGGTDAAPSYTAWCIADPSAQTLHVLADDASASWYTISTRDDGTIAGSCALGLDILMVSDSDPDAYAWLRQVNSARWSSPKGDRTNYIGWQGRGTASESFKVFGSGSGGYSGLGHDTRDNAWTGARQIFPISIADSATSDTLSVFKGHSRVWRTVGHLTSAGSSDDLNITLLNVPDGTRNWLSYRGRAMPWDGSAVPPGQNAAVLGEYIYFNFTTAYAPVDPTPVPPTPTRTRAALAAKAPSVKKVPRILPGQDPALTVAIEPIRLAVNQLIDMPLNQARVLSGVDLDDGVETSIPHSLNRKPLGVIPFNVRGADAAESGGRIDLIPQRDETRSVTLMAIGHGATVTVDLLVF
jgi:hypothetical protein